MKRTYIARYKIIETQYGWHFVLQSPNHRVVGVSEVYESEQCAQQGIAAVRLLSQDKDNFRRLESKAANPQHYFNLVAKNVEHCCSCGLGLPNYRLNTNLTKYKIIYKSSQIPQLLQCIVI